MTTVEAYRADKVRDQAIADIRKEQRGYVVKHDAIVAKRQALLAKLAAFEQVMRENEKKIAALRN